MICNSQTKISKKSFFEKFKFKDKMRFGLIIDLEKEELIYLFEKNQKYKKYLAFIFFFILDIPTRKILFS